ncbi:hypothetical protein GPX89_35480 [Nocardia sp. ET3-3]|uniref:Uncharacterized protein n=1 Tax=Nocardia terrae TaxID=2675851 RepID=A0A7K1V7T5_9NOCA|nr:hypothetical protein [Nocardia terrae]MVU82519.1 hypothetical protein [Nocardia terrae]
MTAIDLDRVRVLLSEHSRSETWWQLRSGEGGALLEQASTLAADADPEIGRRTRNGLDRLVAEEDRRALGAMVIEHRMRRGALPIQLWTSN